jgi:hypothetical protein
MYNQVPLHGNGLSIALNALDADGQVMAARLDRTSPLTGTKLVHVPVDHRLEASMQELPAAEVAGEARYYTSTSHG